MTTPTSWYEYAARALRPKPRLLGWWTTDSNPTSEQVEAFRKVCDQSESPCTIEGVTWRWKPA